MAEPDTSPPPLGAASALGDDEVHVWLARPEQHHDPAVLARCESLLARDEQERLARFQVAKPRHEFLVARAFLRLVLARYAGTAPQALRFGCGEHGKPHLVARQGEPDLRFNLSHTAGLVACVVARDRAVGIDAESASRAVDALALAGRFFAPSEAADLRAAPPEQRLRRFFTYWTLKESYVKAVGAGLSLPLDRFWFHPDEPIGIRFLDERAGDPGRWQFFRLPSEQHLVAVAVGAREDAAPRAVRLRRYDGAPLLAPWSARC
jgi:4'-phosphopantetheinyl transferase